MTALEYFAWGFIVTGTIASTTETSFDWAPTGVGFGPVADFSSDWLGDILFFH